MPPKKINIEEDSGDDNFPEESSVASDDVLEVGSDATDSESDEDYEEDEEDEEDGADESEEEITEDFFLDDEIKKNKVKSKTKIVPSLFGQILTKYEKTALIGYRAQQIVSGADIYVVKYKNDSAIDIAERELRENKLPYYIQRHLPFGNVVNVKPDQLLDIF